MTCGLAAADGRVTGGDWKIVRSAGFANTAGPGTPLAGNGDELTSYDEHDQELSPVLSWSLWPSSRGREW